MRHDKVLHEVHRLLNKLWITQGPSTGPSDPGPLEAGKALLDNILVKEQ
jgi:hypothetical protein